MSDLSEENLNDWVVMDPTPSPLVDHEDEPKPSILGKIINISQNYLKSTAKHALNLEEEQHVAARTESLLAGCSVLEFLVKESEMEAIFNTWKRSLWFAPKSFVESAKLRSVQPTFIPYCQYQAVIVVTHEGVVKRNDADPGDPVTLDIEFESADRRLAILDPKVTKLLSAFEFDWEGTKETIKPNKDTPVLPPSNQIWKVIQHEMMQQERGSAHNRLVLEAHEVYGERVNLCRVEETQTLVRFQRLLERVVYAPVLYFTYTFEDEMFLGLVNASCRIQRNSSGDIQNIDKLVSANRPFGIGSLLNKPLAFLEEVLGVSDDQVGIVEGQKLIQTDEKTNIYNPRSFYIVFPPSNSYLLSYGVGFVTLQNDGPDAVVLRSQLRNNAHFGGEVTLKPKERRTFDYKGRWCIQIVNKELSDEEVQRASVTTRALVSSDSPNRPLVRVVHVSEFGGGEHDASLAMSV